MSADFTIRLEDMGGAMPTDAVGPRARPAGESAVPGKKKASDTDDSIGDTREHLKAIGSDITDLLGLSKVVDFAAKMRETFDHAVAVVNSVRRPAGGSDSGGISPRLPTITPVKPGGSPTSLVPTKTPTPPVTGPTAPPVAHWPKTTDGPPPPTSKVIGPPAAADGVSKVAGVAAGGEGAAGAIASIASAVGPAAIAIGAFTVAAVAGGYAIKKAFDALSNEVGKLEGFSAPVAAAQGRNEVRQEMSLVRRGEEIGPQLGKFADDMGKFQEAQAEVWTQILKVLLKIYEACRPIVEFVTKVLQLIASGIEMTQASFNMLLAEFTATNEDNLKAASEMASAARKFAAAMSGGDSDDPVDPLLATLMSSWAGGSGGGPATGGGGGHGSSGSGGALSIGDSDSGFSGGVSVPSFNFSRRQSRPPASTSSSRASGITGSRRVGMAF